MRISIPRWFYDNKWGCPSFDAKTYGKGHNKRVVIEIEVIKVTEKAIHCYVDIVKTDGTLTTFNSTDGLWIPKSIILSEAHKDWDRPVCSNCVYTIHGTRNCRYSGKSWALTRDTKECFFEEGD